MNNEMNYALPESREKVIEMVRFFPENWAWTGILIAPREVYEQGRIAKHTLLSIQDQSCPLELVYSDFFVNPFEDKQEPQHAYTTQLEDLVIAGKLPARVEFSGAHHHHFDRCARKLSAHYLREGYKGHIRLGDKRHYGDAKQSIIIDHKERTLSCRWKTDSPHEEIKLFLQNIETPQKSEWTTMTSEGDASEPKIIWGA